MRSAQLHLALLDDELDSPLYCDGPMLEAVDHPAASLPHLAAFATGLPCLIRRSDYAAPGSEHSHAPVWICILAQSVGLNPAVTADLGAGSCA